MDDDFKTAEKISELEALIIENLNLKIAALTKDRDIYAKSLALKYTGTETITVNVDRMIIRETK